MNCIECGEPPKYKCPTCRQPYCSVNCCKKHKEKPCSAPTPPVREEQPENKEGEHSNPYEFNAEDIVPLEKLKLLEKSTEVKKCLENPHVREIIELIDKSPCPDELVQEYMTEPIFTEFVDACLKVVQPEEEDSDD